MDSVDVVLVERQNLLPGRGLFFPSLPDLGLARILAALGQAGLSARVLEGTWRWATWLLADPARLVRAAASGRFVRPPSRSVLQAMKRGPRAFAAQCRSSLAILQGRDEAGFWDRERRSFSLALMEFAYSVFEWEVGRHGPEAAPPFHGLVRAILESRPRLVAFSLRDGSEPVTRRLVQTIAAAGIPTVGGGWFTLGMTGRELDDWRRRLGLRWLVSGPGEQILVRLARGERVPDLLATGPVLVAGPGGVHGLEQPRSSPARPRRLGLPLPEEDLRPLLGRPYHAPGPILPLSSNSGCYWGRCAFCPQRYNTGGFAEYAPGAVAERVARYRSRYGIRRFFFVDECIRPEFAQAFVEALRGQGATDCAFVAMARPEKAFSEGLLRDMASVGFRALLWGVESSSDRVLRLMRKGTRIQDVLDVLGRAKRAGLRNFVFLMIGFPGETEREARQTLEFARRHRALIDGAQLSRFVVYANSAVGRDPASFGVVVGRRPSKREVGALDLVSGGVDRAVLDALYEEFVEDYGAFVSEPDRAEPHHFSSAWSLLSYLFDPPGSE